MLLSNRELRSEASALSSSEQSLSSSQIEDLRLAASKLLGAARRSFQAEIALKSCGGSSRLTETVFGWGKNNVDFCLAEHRTGITCRGAQADCGGAKRWEERFPEVAVTLEQIAEIHAQQDSSFLTTITYTRLTAKAASEQLRSLGYPDSVSARSQHNGSDFKSDGLPFETSG